MALEIEYDEATGKIGTLPDPLQKFVNNLIDQSHKGLRQQVTDLESKIKGAGTGGLDAAERERLKAIEDENHRFKTQEAERKAEYDKALKIREEAEAGRDKERQQELDKSKAEVTRRDGRLREMARSEIKIAAKNLGARTESLDELAKLLGADLDLDADLQPFVKGADGKPATDKDGKPVTIEGYVKAYLDKNTHHRAGAGGTGGGARGGASLNGVDPTELEKAEAAVADAQKKVRANRTDTSALNALQAASNHLKEVRAGKKAS